MTAENNNSFEEFLIETERLTMRPFKNSDITDEYIEALNDVEVIGQTEARYRSTPMTRQDAIIYIEKSNNDTSILIGIFKKDGKHIGNIRLHTISSHNKRAELGIMIFDKGEWGKGYGAESLKAAVNFGFDNLGLHKIEAEYYSTNVGSAKIFEKAGFVIEGIRRDHFLVNDRYVHAVQVAKINQNGN